MGDLLFSSSESEKIKKKHDIGLDGIRRTFLFANFASDNSIAVKKASLRNVLYGRQKKTELGINKLRSKKNVFREKA